MDADKIIADIQKLIGKNMPLEIKHNLNGIVSVSYQPEWKEGGTNPVTNKKGEVIDYKAKYKDCSLTKAEIKKLDDYIADITES